ncbi:hypothetical protein [Nostoc sp. NMS4]|nr:hypothetical protein [Nostoc sp. NMS4]
MKTRLGSNPDISLIKIDGAISFAKGYLSLRASIAIAFLAN